MSEEKTQSSEKKRKIDPNTVVVAVTGRIDSAVAAYLLKKQGYNVIALALNFKPPKGEPKKSDGDEEARVELPGVNFIEDLDKVKEVFDKLEITFYAVDATKEYQYYVSDPVIASRIGGRYFNANASCHYMVFEVLKKKAQKVGAGKISSGHYGKIVHSQSTGQYNILVANDIENDQSRLLSMLNQDTLSQVILPLSEMRKQEVLKIGEMLNIGFIEPKEEQIELITHLQLGKYIGQNMAKALFRPGPCMEYKHEHLLYDHEGIHQFYLGQKNLKSRTGTPLDRGLAIVQIQYSSGLVFACQEEDLKFQTISLNRLSFDSSLDISKPQELFVLSSRNPDKFAATLFYKNNGFAVIDCKKEMEGTLFPGEKIVFYNRKGLNGKILGFGEVDKAGKLDDGKILALPNRDDYDDENEEEKKDIYALRF